MKIAILGSWRQADQEWGLRETQEDFAAACTQIGSDLAQCNQTIVVGGEDPDTADSYVVRGIVNRARRRRATRTLIEVVRKVDDTHSFHEQARAYPSLFAFVSQTEKQWAEARFIAIRRADAVITIGGMGGTYQGGLAAIVARKKLVPIGSFGGASVRLIQALENVGGSRELPQLHVLNGPWGQRVRTAALELLGVGRLLRLAIVHGRSNDRDELSSWLREKHIVDPLIMQQEFGAGLTLPEKFEQMASRADAAIVLATPDDVGGFGTERQRARARQNVWLEVGWFWGRLGRDKLLVLCKRPGNRDDAIDIPSDLQGLEHHEYERSPLEAESSIRQFIHRLQDRA